MSDGAVEVTRIQSHCEPRRYLKQHVAEIVAAMDSLRAQHGAAAWRSAGDELAEDLARLHDLGKASAAFQAYIADPARWRGEPREKSHTLLSMVLAVAWAEAAARSDVAMVALALAVRGHHGGQPADEEALHGTLSDGDWRDVLCAQLATVDRDDLAHETGLTLALWSEPVAVVRRAARALRRSLETWRARPIDAMVRERFVARAAYSLLLEADKAFLAVDRSVVKAYLRRERPSLPSELVDARCATLDRTPMDALRARAREATRAGLARRRGEALLTLTLPTGAGKTLLAARWALEERELAGGAAVDAPTVVLALPMLSIVDQTERVWRDLLGVADGEGDKLLPYHSLSERAYDPELPRGTADFFIDTWRSDVVVTTFDQLLLALYSDRAKHAMRYHRLLNARIVIDEVQCVPPALWRPIAEGLRALTALGRTRVLAMSATPAPCLDGAVEVLDDPSELYTELARYELRLEHGERMAFEGFVAQTEARCRAALAAGEGTLVTVNVRATAQETWERLVGAGLDPLLLSGDMTPAHRLAVIDELKRDPVRVVVSTQCVEAGVDLDMHHVIRDLAPLDAIVQIAGRCNRHAKRAAPGTVTIVHVLDPRGRDDAAVIYDPVALQCTVEVLRGQAVVQEREVLALCREWYTRVAARKYTGGDDLARWARIEASIDVRRLMRGEDEQVTVLVAERDAGLKPALSAALAVSDRWERRARLRALSARLARCSVSVARPVFDALATTPLGPSSDWYELLPGQYHPVRGIDSRRRS